MKNLDWLDSLHGFLLVDKPEGITSQDVITRLQRMLIERSKPDATANPRLRKRNLPKMGHGGTLDPFATGLLVLAVGDGTKLARYLIDSEKTYFADVRFGSRTSSGDLTNEVTEETDRLPASELELSAAARLFIDGPYLQTPPMYSAKKIEGKPLYELARQGIEIERAAIPCRVPEFEVISAAGSPIHSAKIRVRVSPGTYIRTLAEDWAAKLGTLAHLTTLRRLGAGPFRVENALTLEALAELPDWMQTPAFLPFDQCLREKLPGVEIDSEEARALLEGRKEVIETLEPRLPATAIRVALSDPRGLRAVFARMDEALEGKWDIERVFPLIRSLPDRR